MKRQPTFRKRFIPAFVEFVCANWRYFNQSPRG